MYLNLNDLKRNVKFDTSIFETRQTSTVSATKLWSTQQ